MPNLKDYILRDIKELEVWRNSIRGDLVLTNGVFDLLHFGHISYLRNACALGNQLLVLVNSDMSVKALSKGINRPINCQKHRAFCLSQLKSVSKVMIFQESPVEIMRICRASIYVKGNDYTLETLNPLEREILQSVGTDIRFIPFEEGFSTTNMIEKIKLYN